MKNTFSLMSSAIISCIAMIAFSSMGYANGEVKVDCCMSPSCPQVLEVSGEPGVTLSLTTKGIEMDVTTKDGGKKTILLTGGGYKVRDVMSLSAEEKERVKDVAKQLDETDIKASCIGSSGEVDMWPPPAGEEKGAQITCPPSVSIRVVQHKPTCSCKMGGTKDLHTVFTLMKQGSQQAAAASPGGIPQAQCQRVMAAVEPSVSQQKIQADVARIRGLLDEAMQIARNWRDSDSWHQEIQRRIDEVTQIADGLPGAQIEGKDIRVATRIMAQEVTQTGVRSARAAIAQQEAAIQHYDQVMEANRRQIGDNERLDRIDEQRIEANNGRIESLWLQLGGTIGTAPIVSPHF